MLQHRPRYPEVNVPYGFDLFPGSQKVAAADIDPPSESYPTVNDKQFTVIPHVNARPSDPKTKEGVEDRKHRPCSPKPSCHGDSRSARTKSINEDSHLNAPVGGRAERTYHSRTDGIPVQNIGAEVNRSFSGSYGCQHGRKSLIALVERFNGVSLKKG